MSVLSVVVVTHNHARWLSDCLKSVYGHAGGADPLVVVVDNESTDGSADLVERDFPEARVIRSANHGFAWGCNLGAAATDSRYVLFLNPDTEISDGTLGELCSLFDGSSDIGLAGARQLGAGGELDLTIRRFPSPLRMLGEALGAERLPFGLGERVRDPAAYSRVSDCDWTVGSFLLVRREAFEAVGRMDTRFFMYQEEVDLCLRLRRAGWRVVHLPQLTLHHHEGLGRGSARLEAQVAWAKLLFARKNLSRRARVGYRLALVLRYALRSPGGSERARAARASLAVALGRRRAPFSELEAPRT